VSICQKFKTGLSFFCYRPGRFFAWYYLDNLMSQIYMIVLDTFFRRVSGVLDFDYVKPNAIRY
jgi:hypothetical protein